MKFTNLKYRASTASKVRGRLQWTDASSEQLQDLLNAKIAEPDTTGITFVELSSDIASQLSDALKSKGLQLYPSKRDGKVIEQSFFVGFAKREPAVGSLEF